MLADSLAKALATSGADLERTSDDRAAATVDALMPDLIVCAGDAAQDRGVAVLAQLSEVSEHAPPPVIVVCAPDVSGHASHPTPRHVGFLAPEGGMNECARRVQALLDLVVDQNLEVCTLQQLADTVSSRAKPSPDAGAATPAAATGRSPTQEYAATAKGMAPLPKPAAVAPQPSAAAKNVPAPANDQSAPSATATKAAIGLGGATTPQRAGTAQMPVATVSGVTAKSTQQLPAAQPAPTAAAVSGAAAKAAAAASVATPKSTQQLPAVQPGAASARARGGAAQMAAVSGDPAKPARAPTAQMPILGGAAAKGTAQSPTATPATSRTGTAQLPAMQASTTPATARTGTAQMPAMQAAATAAMSGKRATAQLPATQLDASNAASAKAVQAASPRTATLQTRVAQVEGIAAAISGALNADPAASVAFSSGELPAMSRNAAEPASQPVAIAEEPSAARSATAQVRALDPAAVSGEPAQPAKPASAALGVSSAVAGKQPLTLPNSESGAEPKVATSPKLPLITQASHESFDDDMEPTIVGKLPLPPSAATPPTSPKHAASAAKPSFKRTLLNAAPVHTDAFHADAPATSPKAKVMPAIDKSSTDTAPTTPNPVLANALSKDSEASATLSSAPTGPIAIISDPASLPEQSTNPFQPIISPRVDAPNARPPLPARSELMSSAETSRPGQPPQLPSVRDALDDKPTLAPSVDSDHPTAPPIAIALSEAPPVNDPELETATVRPSGGEINVTFSDPPQPLEALPQATRIERVGKPTRSLEAVATSTPAQNTRARGPFEPATTTQPRQDPSEPRLRRATSPLEPVAAQPKQDPSEPRVRRPTSPLEPVMAAPQKQPTPARRPTSPLEPVMAAPQAQPTYLAAISGSSSKARRADPLQAPVAWPESGSAAIHDLPVTGKARGSKWRVLAIAGGVAAVGCGVLLLQLRGDSGADHLGGRAAADALQYAPAPAAEPVAPVAIAAVAPSVATTARAERVAPPPSAATFERSATPTRATAASASASHAPPGSPQQLVEDGRVLMRQGRLGLAEGMFLKALAAEPDSSAAMAEIVRVHLARRDGAEAVRWATRLTALPGNQSLAQLLLGDAEALHGDSTAAHDAWTRAARAGNATARQRLDDE